MKKPAPPSKAASAASAAQQRAMARWAKVKAVLDQGLSQSQAAERLGLTVGQVAGLKHRARKAMEARP